MGLADRALNLLRSIFGRRRDEVQSAPSRAAEQYLSRSGPAFNTFAAMGMEHLGAYLSIDENIEERYADAAAMDDYPEISCLTGDMRVATYESQSWVVYRTISEIASAPDLIQVWAYDKEAGRFAPTDAIRPRLTGENAPVVAVRLETGAVLKGTPEHLVLTTAGWIALSTLKPGDQVVSLLSKQTTHFDKHTLLNRGSPYIVKVTSPPEHIGTADVFDLTTEPFHNFVVEGVVVHNSAFTLHADDATVPDTLTGHSMWVESDDEKIKKLGNDLFHKQLTIDDELWGMARGLCQFGNLFEEVLVTGRGVVDLNHLPAQTVRRIETEKGALLGFVQDIKGEFKTFTPEKILKALNDPEEAEPGTAVFEDWQVVHWKLDARRRRGSYGHGIADAARWIWKRLLLMEDSVLVYRLTRSPSRRAFFIPLGNLPPEKQEAALEKIRRKLKKKKFYDPVSGKLDARYNPMALDEDFVIGVREGGESARIEELTGLNIQEMESVEYFLNKLYVALGTPKSFLSFSEEGADGSQILSNRDIRFARKIMRIQRELRNGFKRVFRVHMAALNIDPFAADYEIFMPIPSSVFELAQMEVRNARADFAARMGQFVSNEWLLSEVFRFSDDEIKTIQKQRLSNAKLDGRLEKFRRGEEETPPEQPGIVQPSPELVSAFSQREMSDRDVSKANKMLQQLLESDRKFRRRLDALHSLMREFRQTAFAYNGNGRIRHGLPSR